MPKQEDPRQGENKEAYLEMIEEQKGNAKTFKEAGQRFQKKTEGIDWKKPEDAVNAGKDAIKEMADQFMRLGQRFQEITEDPGKETSHLKDEDGLRSEGEDGEEGKKEESGSPEPLVDGGDGSSIGSLEARPAEPVSEPKPKPEPQREKPLKQETAAETEQKPFERIFKHQSSYVPLSERIKTLDEERRKKLEASLLKTQQKLGIAANKIDLYQLSIDSYKKLREIINNDNLRSLIILMRRRIDRLGTEIADNNGNNYQIKIKEILETVVGELNNRSFVSLLQEEERKYIKREAAAALRYPDQDLPFIKDDMRDINPDSLSVGTICAIDYLSEGATKEYKKCLFNDVKQKRDEIKKYHQAIMENVRNELEGKLKAAYKKINTWNNEIKDNFRANLDSVSLDAIKETDKKINEYLELVEQELGQDWQDKVSTFYQSRQKELQAKMS